jgi:hypothetical protein
VNGDQEKNSKVSIKMCFFPHLTSAKSVCMVVI